MRPHTFKDFISFGNFKNSSKETNRYFSGSSGHIFWFSVNLCFNFLLQDYVILFRLQLSQTITGFT